MALHCRASLVLWAITNYEIGIIRMMRKKNREKVERGVHGGKDLSKVLVDA